MKKIKEFLLLAPAVLFFVAAIVGFRNNVPVFSEIIFPGEKDQVQQGITADRSDEKRKTEETGKEAKKKKEKVTAVSLSTTMWKDGTYTGTGAGYGGPIVAEVVIRDGKIKSIRILSHGGETPEFFARAKKIIGVILRKQTPEVDCIAEATLSSNGIRQAVADALGKAGGKRVTAATVTVTAKKNGGSGTSQKNSGGKKEKVNKGVPADGKFTGSAVCENFGYTVKLTARFRGGRVVSLSKFTVTGNDDPDNEAYWKMAWKPMVANILKNQTKTGAVTPVDVVSGATYSSNAIVNAYLDARNKAIAQNDGKSAENSGKNRAGESDSAQGNSGEDSSSHESPASLDDDSADSESGEQAQSGGAPVDGTYSVSAVCEPDEKKAFTAYTMSADVTFQGGVLTAIENFSSTDESNKSFYMRAAEGTKRSVGVVEQLLANQSAKGLQAVTGATCSSKTIRALYILAKNQAAGSAEEDDEAEDDMTAGNAGKTAAESDSTASTGGTAGSTAVPGDENGAGSSAGEAEKTPGAGNTESPQATPGTGNTEDSDATSGAGSASSPTAAPSTGGIKDGTYTVSTTVYPDEWEDFDEYVLKGDFVFKDGKLEDIKNPVVEDAINEWYCSNALNYVLPQMVAIQGTSGIDACSGATCSSEAFITLYQIALNLAQK